MAKEKYYKTEISDLAEDSLFVPEEQTKKNEDWQEMLHDARHNKATSRQS